MATATLTLDIARDLPSPDEVESVRSRAHKARHDPSVVGDAEAAEQKRLLLAEIAAIKSRGENPGGLFRQMQDLLGEYRERRADEIAGLDAQAERLQARAGESEIAHDRTWAFPLYSSEPIVGLRDEIFAAFGVG